jgi:hypothetical protein
MTGDAPTPSPEEPKMEVHKPKPVHSWREFLKEFGTIVLGVSVALAAEQGVEWVHWQGEVAAARTALRAEITTVADFYEARLAGADCMGQQLDAFGVMIADVAAGQMPTTDGVPFFRIGRLLSDSDWQSERASQTLTHFPREELAQMSRFYAQVVDMRVWSYEEANAWAHLAMLKDGPQKLRSGDLTQLRINYHLARRYFNQIVANSDEQLKLAAQLGIKPAPLSQAQIAGLCKRQNPNIKF